VVLFLGGRHPNSDVPAMPAAARAEALARELGVLGRHVVLHDGWVPYDRRGRSWRPARSGHRAPGARGDPVQLPHPAAGLRLGGSAGGLTSGDVLSEQLSARGCASLVPPGDETALALALEQALTHPPERARVLAASALMAWPQVAEPLLRYLDEPWRAADLARPDVARRLRAGPPVLRPSGPTTVLRARSRRAAGAALRAVRLSRAQDQAP
jgi:hypothetical protein